MNEPARGYSWPPFEEGNQVARTHGVWAKDVDEAASEIVGVLYAPELVARYPAMALLGAQCWVRRRRALADIEERGMVLTDAKGVPREHPLLKFLAQWDRTLLDLSRRFGLDPRSELELARTPEGGAAGSIIEAVRARGRGERPAEPDGAPPAALEPVSPPETAA